MSTLMIRRHFTVKITLETFLFRSQFYFRRGFFQVFHVNFLLVLPRSKNG